MNENHEVKTFSPPLASVVQQFENWRATRGKRGRIPKALWALVAPLIEHYSHNEIATALKLNYNQLKEYVLPLLSHTPDQHSSNQRKRGMFVECPFPPALLPENLAVEFTCETTGSTLKVSGLAATHLQPLIAFLLRR